MTKMSNIPFDREPYDMKVINSEPAWKLAFLISEIDNDNAPIGWSRYIWMATCLLDNCVIEYKEKGK